MEGRGLIGEENGIVLQKHVYKHYKKEEHKAIRWCNH